ncbi:hypothetical protein [Metaclostridioides mangenotii]|uniref:hypothetical protein n=1 Tax=Metaclostridioides mangenotii TaxID=1540 RepID=UPI0028E2EAA0|nr:hypothetical protein [Clostridioides mangenotii]
MKIEKSNIKGIGLDRFRLSKVNVKSIDFKKFKESGGTYIMGIRGKHYFEIVDSNSGEILHLKNLFININSDREGYLQGEKNYIINLSFKRDNKSSDFRCVVEVTAPKLFRGTNEENVNSSEELERIPQVLVEKCKSVGIEIELGYEIVTYIEVNYNIHKEGFKNTFGFLKKVFVESNKVVFEASDREGIRSMMFFSESGNKTRKVKVYDKTKHLNDTNQITNYDSTYRIEVSTNHTSTLLYYFRSPRRDLVSMCKIFQDRFVDFFLNTVKNELVKPYFLYKAEVVEYVVLQMEQSENTTDLLLKLSMDNVLFDVDLLREAIKIYANKKGHDNKYSSNMYRRLVGKLERVNPHQYGLMINNCKMIEELFKEFGFET